MFLALKFAYFGMNDYYGFQKQPKLLTIEQKIQESLIKSNINFKISKISRSIDYASRTDKGVNAWDQTIKFELDNEKIPSRLLYRINSTLPLNIRTWAFAQVSNDFSPRFDSLYKIYTYFYVQNSYEKLDLDLIEKGATLLTGIHNFQNFSKNDNKKTNYIRNVLNINVSTNNSSSVIKFSIKGESFLWQMVRRIVSHLIDLGYGKVDLSNTEALLSSKMSKKPNPLPANGLLLEKIEYP
ncbi:MAG: tRNA pseudouridine(38-40) synthase TruA, partial [Candidatus Thorarchaeota archaeon]